jgi:hypothetical protein
VRSEVRGEVEITPQGLHSRSLEQYDFQEEDAQWRIVLCDRSGPNARSYRADVTMVHDRQRLFAGWISNPPQRGLTCPFEPIGFAKPAPQKDLHNTVFHVPPFRYGTP